MIEFDNEVTCNFERCLYFDGKENNPELSAIIFALRNVNLWYEDKTKGNIIPVPIYDILKAPRNMELLRKKLCEEEEDHTEEEDPEEEIVLVSSLDVADVISQVKER